MLQFRKLILVELYTAFILLYIQYYSSVWHFCGARNVEKLENLNKRILTFTLGHFQSTQDILLDEVNCVSLYNGCIHNMLILLYKGLFLTKHLMYMRNMFNLHF